jgi:micrococcal nuclease
MRRRYKLIIALVIIILSIPIYYFLVQPNNSRCIGNGRCFNSIITEIIDGDTFQIDTDERIRLTLVNTPEIDEKGYQEAKDFIALICPIGSKVAIDQDNNQYSYDRIVALVYCNEKNVNEELLKNNLAVIMTDFCSKSEFANELWAKKYGC